MNDRGIGFISAVLAACMFSGAAYCAETQKDMPVKPGSGYHLLRKISLADEGSWDCLTLDGAARRLYVPRGNRVTVIDIDSYTVTGEILKTDGVHDVAIAPEAGRGFTSNGKSDTVTIFETATLKPVGEVKTGRNPDIIMYDPASGRVFAFNGKSDDATVIQVASGAAVGTVALGGRPEFAAADGKGKVYVNLEDKSAVAVIDSLALGVTAQWSLAPCEEPSGMALDTARQRLFIGCSNKMMAVMDAASGVLISTLPIGERVDSNAFDPATGFAFSSNGDGTLTVAREDSPGKFSVVEQVATQRGARTMALDSVTHRVFLIAAEYGPAPAPTAEHAHPRPPVIPGTVAILVFGR